MPGIYLHIPFCRKACHYCNFHFSTSLRLKDELLEALRGEMALRRSEGEDIVFDTIYFGGGTPSLLQAEELGGLLATIRNHYQLADDPEITLEANPDDLEAGFLHALRDAGINRLSIGIQSFREEDLLSLNRSHDSRQAEACLYLAREAGFDSLNADLIYGIPGLDDEALLENVRKLAEAGVDHVSAYALTVEPRTALDHFVRIGKSPAPEEEQTARQFGLLRSALAAEGFEHYEISNWALPGRLSRHNTSYWQGSPYLGLGPSAHSFDGKTRSWNVAHNPRYIEAIRQGSPEREVEELKPEDHYNEYVMTRLRTRWGCRPEDIAPEFQQHFHKGICMAEAKGMVCESGGAYILTEEGKLFADRVASDLFLT